MAPIQLLKILMEESSDGGAIHSSRTIAKRTKFTSEFTISEKNRIVL
jgi:hypothetical protein